MNVRATVRINAPATSVWTVFTDVERWSSWTSSVSSVEPLDGAGIEVGHRFRIRQPRLPALVWEVTDVDAPHSWTWVVKSPGATTIATHGVSPVSDVESDVAQVIEYRGPLGLVGGLVTRRLTRRYLTMEGAGLKAATEHKVSVAAQP